jgi:hypothetical protein
LAAGLARRVEASDSSRPADKASQNFRPGEQDQQDQKAAFILSKIHRAKP